jgi:hypothetical protein
VCILLVDDCEMSFILITYFVVTLHNNNVLANAKFSSVNIPYFNLMLYSSYTKLNFHLLPKFSSKNLHCMPYIPFIFELSISRYKL